MKIIQMFAVTLLFATALTKASDKRGTDDRERIHPKTTSESTDWDDSFVSDSMSTTATLANSNDIKSRDRNKQNQKNRKKDEKNRAKEREKYSSSDNNMPSSTDSFAFDYTKDSIDSKYDNNESSSRSRDEKGGSKRTKKAPCKRECSDSSDMDEESPDKLEAQQKMENDQQPDHTAIAPEKIFAPVIAAVVGGLVVVLCAVIAFWLYLKRRAKYGSLAVDDDDDDQQIEVQSHAALSTIQVSLRSDDAEGRGLLTR